MYFQLNRTNLHLIHLFIVDILMSFPTETIISRYEQFCNVSTKKDTDAAVAFFDDDAKILIDGFPPFVGPCGIHFFCFVLCSN